MASGECAGLGDCWVDLLDQRGDGTGGLGGVQGGGEAAQEEADGEDDRQQGDEVQEAPSGGEQRQGGEQEDGGSGEGGEHEVGGRERQLEGEARGDASGGGKGGEQDGVGGDGGPARALVAGGAAMHGDGGEDEQRGDGGQDVSGQLGAGEGEEGDGDERPEGEKDLEGEGGGGSGSGVPTFARGSFAAGYAARKRRSGCGRSANMGHPWLPTLPEEGKYGAPDQGTASARPWKSQTVQGRVATRATGR